MNNPFTDIQNKLRNLVECSSVEQKKKSLGYTKFPHTYMVEPPSQITHFLEPETIYSYLEIAADTHSPHLNEKTFYLHDLSSNYQTPYNSLIFEVDGQCYKSTNTTSQIIERFANSYSKPYAVTQFVSQLMGIAHKPPYIAGELFFAPVCKNNWLGLHHVLNTLYDDETTHFLIKNNHELTLQVRKNVMEGIVKDASFLYHYEHHLLYTILKYCNHHQKFL